MPRLILPQRRASVSVPKAIHNFPRVGYHYFLAVCIEGFSFQKMHQQIQINSTYRSAQISRSGTTLPLYRSIPLLCSSSDIQWVPRSFCGMLSIRTERQKIDFLFSVESLGYFWLECQIQPQNNLILMEHAEVWIRE